MTAIDHEKAARIASGYGTTYTTPSDAAVKLVFDAYLEARNVLASCAARLQPGDDARVRAKRLLGMEGE